MTDSKYYNHANTRRPSQAVSSRRAKVEEKKMVQQTVVFAVSAVVLGIIFFFVVIPGVVRFIGGLYGGPTIQEDDVIPQVPLISAPLSATSSAELVLNGFSQKDMTIVIVNNGSEATRIHTEEDGSFKAEVTLQEGENKLAAYAIGAKDKESAISQEYAILFDNKKPKLEISEPKEGTSVQGNTNRNITIKGTTDPDTKVYINDRLIFVNDDGTFSTTHRLDVGDNGIAFKAIDQAGNQTETKVTVKFSE